MNMKWCFIALAAVAFSCSGASEGESKWDLSETANNESTADDSSDDTDENNHSDDRSNNTVVSNNDANNSTNNDLNNTTTAANNLNNSGCLPSVPVDHRPAARDCSADRQPGTSPDFEGDWPCESDADCSADPSGRCTGNGHDGWYCTYNECLSDAACGPGAVCECGGGFRSDHNVCLPGNCVTDADCGETGFCSPSQGDCGAYFGTVGYFCHTCQDECVSDSDCGNGDPWGAYCMYDPGVGHWRCSDSQCAG